MEKELKHINTTLMQMNNTLIRHDENLKEHMRRTELLERQLEKSESKFYSEISPIKKHVLHVEGALKLLGLLSVIAGILSALSIWF
jgi:hypothetical protein